MLVSGALPTLLYILSLLFVASANSLLAFEDVREPHPACDESRATEGSPSGVSDSSRWVTRKLRKRQTTYTYDMVFEGTGTGPDDRDRSIQGSGLIRNLRVDNSTYNLQGCMDFCNSLSDCAFINLFYDFNTPEWLNGPSNLNCVAYSQVHSVDEKTNRGGQQLLPNPPYEKSYNKHSSGYARVQVTAPAPLAPAGYQVTFGQTVGVTDQLNQLSLRHMESDDPNDCAALCNAESGCVFFNFARLLFDKEDRGYMCRTYDITKDQSSLMLGPVPEIVYTQSSGFRRS